MGVSRGGELALLLGATFPILRAVVAYSPSHVVWPEIAVGFRRRRSAWSHQGGPLPFVDMPLPKTPAIAARVFDANPEAVIAVERINGAVLAVSGTDDTLWPSSLMADHVMKRLADHRHPFPFEHLKYVGAGHAITRPYVATRGLPHGGTAAGAGASERALVGACSLLPASESRTVTSPSGRSTWPGRARHFDDEADDLPARQRVSLNDGQDRHNTLPRIAGTRTKVRMTTPA